MTRARGFEWGLYVDDRGQGWAMAVDADYLLAPGRGWAFADTPGVTPFPRGWRPRRVLGLDPSGRRQSAVVADTSAGLWTGADTEFYIWDSAGEQLICTVIRLVAEHSPAAIVQP